MKRKGNAKATRSEMAMVHPNAAAIDIGATMHMAAVGADRNPIRFGTLARSPGTCAGSPIGSAECGVKTVVMESTSVYWIPIFELLDERGFEIFLVNARDAKHVPGRKTDVSDAQWLQRLHTYGLLRASFRPKGEIAKLRAYLRQRERLLDTAASQIQHMQKAMTEMKSPTSSCRGRHHWGDRHAHHPCDHRRGAQPVRVGVHARQALPFQRGDDREGPDRPLSGGTSVRPGASGSALRRVSAKDRRLRRPD